MKTKEELNALRNEVEALNRKLAELTDDEMKQVNGGFIPPLPRANLDDRYVMDATPPADDIIGELRS